MSVCSWLRLVLLVCVNVLFFVIGIGVVIVAIWSLGWPHSLQQEMTNIAPKLILMAFRESAATNMGSLILTIGAVTLIVTVIGLHGTIMKRVHSLTVYAVILIFIALLQAGVGIGCFMFYLGGGGKHRLISGLQNNYRPKDKANLYTIIYDSLFVSLECCGVNNFTDFDSTNLNSSSSEIPWSCCEMTNKWELIMKDPLCPESTLSNTNAMKRRRNIRRHVTGNDRDDSKWRPFSGSVKVAPHNGDSVHFEDDGNRRISTVTRSELEAKADKTFMIILGRGKLDWVGTVK